MYQLSDEDKRLIELTGKALNLRLETFNDDTTDTLVDINGTHTVDYLDDDGQFLVCQVTVIPGVRYHSDGSGTPDDVDVTELTTHRTFGHALAEAVSLAAKLVVEQTDEYVTEEADMARHRARFPEEF